MAPREGLIYTPMVEEGRNQQELQPVIDLTPMKRDAKPSVSRELNRLQNEANRFAAETLRPAALALDQMNDPKT